MGPRDPWRAPGPDPAVLPRTLACLLPGSTPSSCLLLSFPVLAVQALISALGAGLAALTADRLWGRRAGWLAGLLYAGLWTSIYYSAELLLETLSVTLNLLLLWLLLDRDAGRPGWRRLGLAGLALGLSAI
ncbi:MAG: glycosyltransferase family 39 protein, partial [bacterium]|nr:glycosyltransferase family 39 protein [bacterium]